MRLNSERPLPSAFHVLRGRLLVRSLQLMPITRVRVPIRASFTSPRTETVSPATHCRPVDLIVTAAVVAADIGAATDDPDQIVYKG
jgi:hypothetical protein